MSAVSTPEQVAPLPTAAPEAEARPQPAPNGPAASPAQQILAGAQEGRFVLEDFRPLADSLEWELGQDYLRQRGSKAFISDASPVPFIINNDGSLSRHAAEVFFASLLDDEREGRLEAEIFVLELGIGVGLFARFFLDAFRELCVRHGKDYYGRLCYVAADRSERMLADACRHGIFANHAGHYLVRVVDAMQPEATLADDLALARHFPRPFRGVFLNYLLDCLPAADLKMVNGRFHQLYVRTCLARHLDLAEYTSLSQQELARRARSPNPADRRTLLELYGLFASEYDYLPVDAETLPYRELAAEFAGKQTEHFLHNYGAIQALERLLALLHERGLILVNDYGQTEVSRTDEFEHQRFSHATFVGINFPLLQAYFADGGRCQWAEPEGESGRIHSRLLGHQPAAAAVERFRNCYGKAVYEWEQEPVQLARAYARAARFEGALTAYHKALERQPNNWVLMNEIALFLTFTLRNPRAGAAMAEEALALNPSCSADLWNTLGDCWFEYGRVQEARGAYQRALRVDPEDVRARYNLTWVLVRERKYKEGLALIAEALALDEGGEYYERLVRKQNEVMARLAQRQQQKYFYLANRVSKRPGPAGPERPELSQTTGSQGEEAPKEAPSAPTAPAS